MPDQGTLEIRNVFKRFEVAGRTVEALSGIDLSVAPGEFVSVVGASGCGKSTLLRLIVGLDRDYDGEILLDGRRLAGPTLDRAIVFQEHRLFPWLRVEDNVALGLLKSALPAAEKRKLVREHLELVGLSAFAGAYPAQLSGGMSQRVAIARALVVRRARRADQGLSPGRTPADRAERRDHRRSRHPRRRGGDLPGGQDRRHAPPPGANRGNPAGRCRQRPRPRFNLLRTPARNRADRPWRRSPSITGPPRGLTIRNRSEKPRRKHRKSRS